MLNFKNIILLISGLLLSLYVFATDTSTSIVTSEIKENTESGSGVILDDRAPAIDSMKATYNNGKGEFFVYGKKFGSDKTKIKVILFGDNYEKELEVIPSLVHDTIITGDIKDEFQNGSVKLVLDGGKDDAGAQITLESNIYEFKFNLPKIHKVFTEGELGKGSFVTIEGSNFKKPTYGLLGTNRFVCEEETETSCRFKIDVSSEISGKFGIESFGFKDYAVMDDLKNPKLPIVKLLSASSGIIDAKNPSFTSIFDIKVENYSFEELRKNLENDKEAALNIIGLKSGIKMVIDGKEFSGKAEFKEIEKGFFSDELVKGCVVNKNAELKCIIDKEIVSNGVGYVEIFGAKSRLFSYSYKDIPKITKYNTYNKWSSYAQIDQLKQESVTIQGNMLFFEVGLSGLEYAKKNALRLHVNNKIYSIKENNFIIEPEKVVLRLMTLPDKKGKYFLTFGAFKTNELPYDLSNFTPYIQEIGKLGGKDEFYIIGKNLTSFNDQNIVIKFGNAILRSDVIENYIIASLKKNTDILADLELKLIKETNVDKINELKSDINRTKKIIDDLREGKYDRVAIQKELDKGEILQKSNERVEFKIFAINSDKKTSITKGEYNIIVSANGVDSNKISLFYDPIQEDKNNIAFAYPEVESLYYMNGAGNLDEIMIRGKYFDYVEKVLFGDMEAKIVDAKGDAITVDVASIKDLPIVAPLTMGLKGGQQTNTLMIYQLLDDKSNKIHTLWQKDNDQKKYDVIFNINNAYNDTAIKHLALKLNTQKGKDLNDNFPFYNFVLFQDDKSIANGIVDKESGLITFDNINLDITIPLSTSKQTVFGLKFDKIKNPDGELSFIINKMEFYNLLDTKNIIDEVRLNIVGDELFYEIKSAPYFCREKIALNTWDDCGDTLLTAEEGDPNFKPIQSDFISPNRDTKKVLMFTDIVKGNWYYDFTENLYQRGIIKGYKDATFRPQNNITRAEAIKMLLLARDEQGVDSMHSSYSFNDIDSSHWAKNLLEYSVKNGFLRPVNNFHPNKFITRAETAKLIVIFFGRQSSANDINTYFNDISGHWVGQYAKYLYDNGIVSGIGDSEVFNPDAFVTRAEFSKMLSKSIELWSNGSETE